MWEAVLPPEDDPLRQGDLLAGVFLPRLKFPLQIAHVPGSDPSSGAGFLTGLAKDFLVVSQCCEIENGEYVAVTVVKSTPPLKGDTADIREGLLAEEPPKEGEEGRYVFDLFRLEPLLDIVIEENDRFRVADLGQTMSFGGETDQWTGYRRARMTPEGRRLLRIKLSLFFGRAEAEDADHLVAKSIPVGLTP